MKYNNQQKKEILILSEGSVTVSSLMLSLKESFNKQNYEIKTVNAKDLRSRKTLNPNVHALILPGVQDSQDSYRDVLDRKISKLIKKYIEKGDILLGLCAGAYLSTEEFFYSEIDKGTTKNVKPNLKLFEGIAFGPIQQYTPDKKDFKNPALNNYIVKLDLTSQSDACEESVSCYSLGPYIDIPDKTLNTKEYKVIARYKDVPQKPIAIVSRKIGRGKAIFSGVCPEISGKHMPDINKHFNILSNAQLQTAQSFAQQLSKEEVKRVRTWNVLMKEMH
jgi:glutamine amidotransferase-like uncharacterized protein